MASLTLPRASLTRIVSLSPKGRVSFRAIQRNGSALQRSRLVVAAEKQEVSKTERLEELKSARADVEELIKSKHCNPILVRIAWHDSGSYDKDIAEWPQRGGANGSIRFAPEIGHGANAGLTVALDLLTSIADKHPGVSYADLFQMASAAAIELAGGPHIPLQYGRRDVDDPVGCAPEGRLPAAAAPFPGGGGPGDHLRRIFYRMGMSDMDIVALSGAHTLGRCKPSRSGFGKESTKYTEKGPGTPGGSSWTVEWLKFDNSYFTDVKEPTDDELIVLETDGVLFADEGFRPYAEKYAADQDAFFADYVKSHLKLSELGVEWVGEAVTLS